MYPYSPPHYIYFPSLPHVQANCIDISYTKCIKYPGIFFDINISLRLARNSTTLSTAIIISSSFILPHFDSHNSILLNLEYYQINRIHLVHGLQDSVARGFFKIDRFSLLKYLHWLTIKIFLTTSCSWIMRIFTTNLIFQKSSYSLFHSSPLDYSLRIRSKNTHQLQLPDKLHFTNIRTWSISIPYYWNSLSLVILSATVTYIFKSLLKTHMFQQAYPGIP